jgi:malate permease and related proteins
MNVGLTVFNQVAMMFLLMVVGYFLLKYRVLTDQGTEQVSAVLLKVVTPALIIMSFNIPFEWTVLQDIGLAFILAMGSILVGVIIARLVYRDQHRIEQFAIIFSNVGFFGIPLVTGLLGLQYVLYLSAYILAFNILVWSLGMYLVTGKASAMRLTAFVKTPAFVSLILGLIVFISPIKLSGFVQQSVNSVGLLNTPLAMIVVGTYLAKSPLKDIFTAKKAYKVALLRLILIPIITLLLLTLFSSIRLELRMVTLIAASAPSAAMLAIFSQLYGDDYAYGARLISLTTLLSMISIPLIITLAYILWI